MEIAQENPVAAALPGGEICWMWQRRGTCELGKDCKNANSHKPENAPKDKDGNPIKKGKGKGNGKGKKGKKGKGKGKKGDGRGRGRGRW